jgi:hypothetical protein
VSIGAGIFLAYNRKNAIIVSTFCNRQSSPSAPNPKKQHFLQSAISEDLFVYQIMAEDHVRKNVGECHPYREFEGMQPSR